MPWAENVLAPKRIVLAAVVATLLCHGPLHAQSFRQGGTTLDAMRPVSILAGKSYSIVVTEFFHHGEISPDGRNVLVATRRRGRVPLQVLQLGPGDFCRLALQTAAGESSYEIYYGGEPPQEGAPPWTCRDGLLLETRKYRHCDLRSLDSVRNAFNASQPFGSDYVENVHHSRNPFSLKTEPFLSRYSGYLQITSAGTYGLLTSSRDSSFLLIDGKEVVSRVGPLYRATRGTRKDVRLSAGSHKFDYYHAAAGPNATMVAAWEVSPADEKPKPAAIPTEAFRTAAVGRLPAGHVTLQTGRPMPDFVVQIDGDVPLPGNSVPLIGVFFRDNSPKNLTMQAKVQWDFGDGQTSDKLNIDHVYLRPGIYRVTLSVKRSGRTIEMTNRVNIDRPAVTSKDLQRLEKDHTLDNYLSIVQTYDPRKLDAFALRQLVLAYEAKAMAVEDQAEEARKYIAAAVEAGKAAFVGDSAARGAADLHKLAKLVGPMARDRLGDSQLAFQIWQGAAAKIDVAALKGECEVEAADVAIHDLLDAPAAKKLLDAAAPRLGSVKMGPLARAFHRVRGDYFAHNGNGEAARKAYHEAEQILGFGRRYIERTAWRGAHSRSAEEFIRHGQHDRAAAEIRTWQSEFPSEKIDGYLTLTYARYWAGRRKYAQAIAQAEQLQTVNPDSPYIDQVLLLAAECEVRRGRTDRALATLHGLVKDYPGSPLVPDVKKIIARLESGQTEPPKKPLPRSSPPSTP